MANEEVATFAGGCFWCTEALFRRIKGVQRVESGYAGDSKAVSYEIVSSGTTKAAEAISITFDPSVISFPTLLEVFFKTHDPTTKDQQGADHGPQYRSVIFYHSQKQQDQAIAAIQNLDSSHYYPNPIVTEVIPYTSFTKAEASHQQYYEKNKQAPYCKVVIDPKIKKLTQQFSDIVISKD